MVKDNPGNIQCSEVRNDYPSIKWYNEVLKGHSGINNYPGINWCIEVLNDAIKYLEWHCNGQQMCLYNQ